MLYDGIRLVEGATVTNLAAEVGANFPASPDIGEIFMKTGADAGLHAYDGSQWKKSGGVTTLVRYLSQPGNLVIFTGKARWYPLQSSTITSISASVDTAAIGSDIVLELKKNGVTVASPTIPAGQNKGAEVALSIEGLESDYFTIDIVAIGSSTPGADLSVGIQYQPTI